ncbi:MAG TPA: MraY family glycosyltransferase [Vicinamibacterales bacterium]|nr:MraY family glycosyltransferase [Vicinamibacterales bacterium]
MLTSVHALAAATALLASLGLTPVATKLALHFGAIDQPGPRKVHLAPVPLWGGLAIYCAAMVAFTAFTAPIETAAGAQITGIVLAAGLLVAVGALDDRGLLHHQIKLMAAMPVASLILIAVGIHATTFEALAGPSRLMLLADLALTMFWLVGITAAFSILDHMDGLVAGIASIGAAVYLFYAVGDGQVLVGVLAAAVLGAALGFLRWNFAPARIFMGDGGAMFLGFMMATLGLKLRTPHLPALNAQLVPVLILAVPIFDTTLVTISRSRRGLVPFSSPGKDHTSHRLSGLGLGHRRAVLVLYGVAGLGGAAAVLLSRVSSSSVLWLLVGAAVAGAVGVIALERSPFERQPTASPSLSPSRG